MKLLRVGGADERVSIGGVISLAFRNSMSSCNPARVSCVAALGCNEAGEMVLCLRQIASPRTSGGKPQCHAAKNNYERAREKMRLNEE